MIWMIAKRALGTATEFLKRLHTDGFLLYLVFRLRETLTTELRKGGWKL